MCHSNYVKRLQLHPLALLGVLVVWLSGCATPNARGPGSEVELPVQGAPGEYQPGEISEELNLLYQSAVEAWNKNDTKRADLLLSQVISQNPSLASPYTFRGLIAQTEGRMDEAAGYFEQAIARNGAEHKALHQLALLAREEGAFGRAEALYLEAIENRPNEAKYHRNLAILYDLYLGEFDKAIRHYEAYQQYNQVPDKQVALWVVDLKRRVQ